jgi:phospholipase A1/A2
MDMYKSKRVGAVALVAVALVQGGLVFAQGSPPSIADCAAIQTDQARLACYDRASGRLSAIPTQGDFGGADRTVMTAPPTPMPEPGEPPAAVLRASAETSMIDKAWAREPGSERYNISFYRPNYLLIGNYTNNINSRPFSPIFTALEGEEQDLDSTEARFQISFKFRAWASDDRRWGIWAAYTQTSQWQIYNDEISRPFRDTNYMPELMVSFRPDVSFGGFDWRLLNVGYNHQSNGRSDPISRSWDRIIATIGIERDNFALILRPWVRIDKDDADDDNPDITDFYGYGDITALYKWQDHSFTLMGRGNPSTDKGAAELTWTSPRLVGPLRAYVRGFTGYGDSLIDYNWRQNTIGVGVTLNDLL